MKCILAGPNARIFAKSVQALAKFGAELFIEVDKSGFQLRSVNANKSAVGTFKFNPPFFEFFDIAGTSRDDENCCRLAMKPCLGVFKNMKQVETCQIQIDPINTKFLVQMNCQHEAVKHFALSIIDDETITADVPTDGAPNSIGGTCKIFSEIVSNFHALEEELSFEAGTEKLNVKNYVEGSRVNENFMKSQIELFCDEFDEYNISEEAAITFCLRELKAFLLFADAVFENVRMKFGEAGSPVIFQIKKANVFECILIMSSLSPDDISFYEEPTPRCSSESFLSNTEPPLKRKQRQPQPAKRVHVASAGESTTQSGPFTVEDDEEVFQFDAHSVDLPRHHNAASTSKDTLRVPDASEVFDSIPPPGESEELLVTFVETDERVKDLEEIPQSPGCSNESTVHRRALRTIFSRCFEATYVPREPSPEGQLFVPDSDEER